MTPAARLAAALSAGRRLAGSTGRRIAAGGLTRWRRSLQFRIVATTLLISMAVVLLLGLVLLDQVSRGLLRAKQQAALAEANSGLNYAENQLSSTDRTDVSSTSQILDDLTFTLASRGSRAGLYDVVILSTSSVSSGRASGDIDLASIPPKLSTAVRGGQQAFAYTSLRRAGHREPGLAVGAPLISNTGVYELYYLFPLAPEAATLSLVERTLAFAGIALVLLLAGIAALVTRQVVTPVRMAARIAERLAAGALSERMTVRGEDDLALLASSYNRMAEGLQRQIGQLEELSRVQRRFVSDVSHELRTPLTTVRMAADVLHAAREDFPPSLARSAELLQTELDRFEQLLSDLLEISRYDAKAADLEAEPIDLGELVRRVADAVAPLAARRGSDLVLRLPSIPVIAEVDGRRIERVLRNLLVNAVEHGDGLPVEVSLAGGDDAVAIAVRDHGVGLRPGEAGLVFNRFWRADPSRARHTGGTGLGLSIALEDARLHGGWLQAWGEIGRGTQFRLTVPCRAGDYVRSSPLDLEPVEPVLPASRSGGQRALPMGRSGG